MAFRTRTRIPAVDTVESRTTAPPRRSRSAATPRLPIRPHLRWVCVQNYVKDRNPLRDEENRWGKPSSAICRRPSGASAAKIDAIFPCGSLLAACGCRRQISLIYELPTELIDNHLTNLPHYGRPCTQAPHTIAAERKPASYQNSRVATHRRTKIDKIKAPHNTKLKANMTTTVPIKHISRRG